MSRPAARAPAAAGSGLVSVLLLSLAVLASAVAVIHVKYLTRTEFVELQTLRTMRDALDVEWGQLQLEEAALTTHTRVERAAHQRLNMHMPTGDEVRVVEVRVSVEP